MSEPELLTAREVASRLKISASKVYELAASGQLATIDAGGMRFPSSGVDAFLRSCRVPATVRSEPAAKPAPAPQPLAERFRDDPGFVQFFGLDRPKVEHEPRPAEPELTPAQRRRQREQEQWRRIEERRALVAFHANKRRAAKIHRTPPWADMGAIREFYAAAQRITQATGKPHHVDHVIPLQGRLVSGLHVPNNLQILPGSENSKKHNRFEIEA